MASRKWLVRSLCLAFLAALIGGALFLYTWVSPEFIRGELAKQLGDRFNDVDVEVQSAQMRLLGGISVTDLRLVRRDDPNRTPFLHVPSAILYHDKEHLNGGRLVIRKIEMFKPRLRVERDEAGKWNLAGVLKPTTDDETKPLFVFHDASIIFVDRRSGELPVAEWKNIEATLINDPVPVFAFQARGDGKPTGPFVIDGRFDERSGFIGSLDLPAIPVGADLTRAIEAAVPDYGDLTKPLTGKLSAHLDVVWQSGPTPALYHDLRVQLKEGRYEHAVLPLPLERIEVSFRSKNGDITLEKATARVGGGTISATMDLPKNPAAAPLPGAPNPGGDPLDNIPERLRRLDISAVDLTISPEIFQILPDKAQAIREMLMPSGPLNFTYSGRRQEGVWKKNLTLQPNGMEATYRGFPYRVRNLRGIVSATSAEGTPDNIAIDLTGEGLGTSVSFKGNIKGTKPDTDIDLTIVGKAATLDRELIDALPDDNPAILRTLHPAAFGDFVALIRQNPRTRREYGPDTFDNLFTLNIRKGAMKCDAFPIPLEEISGTLSIRTVPEQPTQLPSSLGAPSPPLKGDSTTLEFKDFRATHHGGVIRGNGRKDPAPGGSILALRLDGEGVALDGDLRQALAAIKMENAWNALDPSGRMNCAMSVKLYTKTDPAAKPNAAEDLELSMAFAGATVRPNFFPYQLDRVAGKVAYAKGRIDLREFRAKHGQTELNLPYSEILFRPSGGYWADVRDLRLTPLVIDDHFLQALPPGLKSACEDLELKGPMSLHVARMVVDEKPGPYLPRYLPGAPGAAAAAEKEKEKQNPSIASAQGRGPADLRPILPTIYWDGSLTMAGASLKTGVPWEDIHGQLASWGLYKGDRLGAVRGNIAFDKATVAKQPVEAFSAQLRVDPRQPDVLSVPAIHGKLYGGDVGGEAWVVLDSPVRYALQLNAAHIRLSDIARHYKLPAKVHLEGLATGEIYLANRFDERTGLPVLQGGGSIDVPSGKLLNLPVLLNLIKVVKLRVPDETGFEEAHALFYIRGNRLKFGTLDLIGNAISLAGEGEMTLDGKNVHFEFFPVWTKLKEMFAQTGDWTGAISKRFLKIKVSGDIDKLDYKAEPVPGIVDPVKRVLERIKK